jgi:hypothetical protein
MSVEKTEIDTYSNKDLKSDIRAIYTLGPKGLLCAKNGDNINIYNKTN